MNLPNKISIIGLGLMGGSIAKAVKKRTPHCQIASLQGDWSDLQLAKQSGAVDMLFKTWEELIAWSDWVILATPMSTLCGLAEEIGRRCPKEKKLLVLDIGSVKKNVIPVFERLTVNEIEFLSTHPMAGKETWGFAHSDPDLFIGRPWLVIPHHKNKKESLQIVSNWIETLNAKPMMISPEKHDKQTALISHLPALISRLLLQFVEEKDPDALQIAGPCFHSTTRVARDNPQLWKEIFSFNEDELNHQMAQWLEFAAAQRKKR